MSSDTHSHIVKYKTFILVLLVLLALTFISVAITEIDLGRLAVVGALLLATAKSALVLWHFMHLKYENRLYIGMIGMVLFVFVAVMIVTFLDYSFQ